MKYYLNLVVSLRAPELIFCIAVSEFRVRALVFLLLSALIVRTVDISTDPTAAEDIAARGYFFFS